MDKRLMLVNHYFKDDDINMQELANYLQISPRQLSRLLNSWQDKGWIKYIPGVGRGNKIEMEYLVDIEKEIFFDIVNRKNSLSLSEVKSYLDLPWKPEIAQELSSILAQPYSDNEDLFMMDYIIMMPKELHPAHAIDTSSVHVIMQIYETLYAINPDGGIDYQLLRYDEWEGQSLHLYLEKGVLFSDRTLLTSRHVKESLEYLRSESEYQMLFQTLYTIEIVDDFHLILHFNEPHRNIAYQLAEPFSSIYKSNEDRIGTGPYKLIKHIENEIVLEANHFYRHKQPDIKRVYLFTNNIIRQKPVLSSEFEAKDAVIYLGDEYIMFNKTKTTLTLQQRKYLRFLITEIIYTKMLPQHAYFDHMKLPTRSEFDDEIPEFHQPVKYLIDVFFKEENLKLCRYLEEYGVPIETLIIETDEFIATDLITFDADLVWVCEAFHQTQPLMSLCLMTYCKFKEWFQKDLECHQFLLDSRVLSITELRVKSEKMMENLIDMAYYIPLYKLMAPVALPKNLKNIEYNPYGIFKYHKVIQNI